ncbi:MAG: DUF58 domain-containing protein [Lishizhenia sp.]
MSKINRESLAQFGNLELLAKQVVEGFITGMHKSPFHGFSVEFAEHRLYNKGESTKHIDWKLFARSEKLFTKKYEEETNLRCQLVLDCSSSMLFPKHASKLNKLEYSAYCIASLIELLKKQRDAVGLSLFSDNLELHTPAKSSKRHLKLIYQKLEEQMINFEEAKSKSTSTIQAMHDIAELTRKRSLVVLFSDFLDDPSKTDAFFQAIQHLKHNKHEVVIFHIVDKENEIDFELENRPHHLIDMETGEKIKLQPNQIKETYKSQITKYFKEIETKCKQYAVDFTQVDIQQDFNFVLSKYLIKRGKLY